MSDKRLGVGAKYQIPDELWERIRLVLPVEKRNPKGGRPREDARLMMTAIFYLLRTGCQWNGLPRSLGASSTVHDRFQEWREAGVFVEMWATALAEYDREVGIDWEWQSMDGAMTKAPLGGDATGPNPTDRGKKGTKRSLLTDGYGIPLGLAVDGANRHDKKMAERTIESIVIGRPQPSSDNPQNMLMDKGYDYPDIRQLVIDYGYIGHIKARGEEIQEKKEIPGYRARRWVVERTHSWMNRFRRLLIRWEKKVENYVAMLHFACAWITFRSAGVFG